MSLEKAKQRKTEEVGLSVHFQTPKESIRTPDGMLRSLHLCWSIELSQLQAKEPAVVFRLWRPHIWYGWSAPDLTLRQDSTAHLEMSPQDMRELPIFAEWQVGVISEIMWKNRMKVKTKWFSWVDDVPDSRGGRCCCVKAQVELESDGILNAVTILFL